MTFIVKGLVAKYHTLSDSLCCHRSIMFHSKMKTNSIVPDTSHANYGHMRKTVSHSNNLNHRVKNRDNGVPKQPEPAVKHNQEHRERHMLAVSTNRVQPRGHQRCRSADFSQLRTSSLILVKKNKKEPQLPERGASLRLPPTTSFSSFKRYSCPPLDISSMPCESLSSSSRSSSSSNCLCYSSPPPLPTTVITGHDPEGWKLRLKPTSTSYRAHTRRLSLQIPLPVVPSEPTPISTSTSKPDHHLREEAEGKTKPPLKPKPVHRHYSDSAVVRPLPALTLAELRAVCLRPVTHSQESDSVFSEPPVEDMKKKTLQRKIPPPVPEKTLMARQIARLMALAHRCRTIISDMTEGENIYSTVTKPKLRRPPLVKDPGDLRTIKSGK